MRFDRYNFNRINAFNEKFGVSFDVNEYMAKARETSANAALMDMFKALYRKALVSFIVRGDPNRKENVLDSLDPVLDKEKIDELNSVKPIENEIKPDGGEKEQVQMNDLKENIYQNGEANEKIDEDVINISPLFEKA